MKNFYIFDKSKGTAVKISLPDVPVFSRNFSSHRTFVCGGDVYIMEADLLSVRKITASGDFQIVTGSIPCYALKKNGDLYRITYDDATHNAALEWMSDGWSDLSGTTNPVNSNTALFGVKNGNLCCYIGNTFKTINSTLSWSAVRGFLDYYAAGTAVTQDGKTYRVSGSQTLPSISSAYIPAKLDWLADRDANSPSMGISSDKVLYLANPDGTGAVLNQTKQWVKSCCYGIYGGSAGGSGWALNSEGELWVRTYTGAFSRFGSETYLDIQGAVYSGSSIILTAVRSDGSIVKIYSTSADTFQTALMNSERLWKKIYGSNAPNISPPYSGLILEA